MCVCVWQDEGDTTHITVVVAPLSLHQSLPKSPRLGSSSLPSVSATFHPHQPSFQIVSPLDPTTKLECRPSVYQSSVHLSVYLPACTVILRSIQTIPAQLYMYSIYQYSFSF